MHLNALDPQLQEHLSCESVPLQLNSIFILKTGTAKSAWISAWSLYYIFPLNLDGRYCQTSWLFLLGQWNLIFSILFPASHKKALALSNFIKNTAHFIFLFTNFLATKKYLIKILFNDLKTMLQQCLNKPLDVHYRHAVVRLIPVCTYWLENK